MTHWLAESVIKQHGTMGTLLNTLIGAGFSIQHVNEWGPRWRRNQRWRKSGNGR